MTQVYCINMHCDNSLDSSDAIPGDTPSDWYCSQDCKLEDELREKAGLNGDKWQTKTYLENGELKYEIN